MNDKEIIESLQRQLAAYQCPLNLSHSPDICSAGTCFECVKRQLAEVQLERDYLKLAAQSDKGCMMCNFLERSACVDLREKAEAEIARMRPVVESVLAYDLNEYCFSSFKELVKAIEEYEQSTTTNRKD